MKDDVIILLNFSHIGAKALTVNPYTRVCCNRSTSNEDRGGGGEWQHPKPKHVKKNPVRLG